MEKTQASTFQASGLDLIGLAARVLPVLAVLLPVAGIVTRFVALSFDGVPLVAIMAADPALLVATAVFDLVDVLLVLALALALARGLTREGGRLSVAADRAAMIGDRTKIAMLVALAAVIALVLVLGVRFTTIPVTVAALLLVAYWQRRARRWGELTFSRIWLSTALFFVFAAAMGGLSGMAMRAGYYEFFEETKETDGFYVLIGRSANMIYLRSCGQPGVPLHQAVNEDNVDRAVLSWENETSAEGARTLWDVATGQRPEVGARYICPLEPEDRPSPPRADSTSRRLFG